MARPGSERPAAGGAGGPLPGSSEVATFGKYRLFASLGRGGMADVFLAVSRGPLGFNKLVVVKRLRSALADDGSFLTMFLDEARLAARLSHPNVVHTYEVGEHDGAYFIAMEYLEGQPLNRVVKDLARRHEELDEGMCARIVADALAGLHHAHTLRDYDGRPLEIVHRDVSPHNIFVTYDGQVKLVDFGIAKAASSSTVTEVGIIKGKVAYMAPEQAMGAPVDCRADLFGMGAVLWELLARRRLLAADTAAATLHRLLHQPIPPVSTVRDVDSGLAEILARSLEKDAARRYQSAHEMREALEEWLRTSGHKVRHEEIGARISAMYADVREDVKRQVQEQMSLASAPGDVAAPPTSERSANVTTRTMRLPQIGAGSGSGSGVIAVPPPPREDGEPEPKRRGVIAAFVAILFAALTVVAILLQRAAVPPNEGARSASASVSVVLPEPPTPPSVTASAPAPTPIASASAVTRAVTSALTTVPPPVVPTPTRPPPVATTVPRASATATTAPDDNSPGFLTFDTYPWTRVTEGGRLLGATPLIKVQMSPGPHTLLLENAEQGIKKTYTVTIKSGETFSMRLGLAK